MNMALLTRKWIREYREAGYELRPKTAEEIREDCRRMDCELPESKKSNVANANAARRGVKKRKKISDARRRSMIASVHSAMAAGATAPVACEAAGVKYITYMKWRERYNITEPALRQNGGAR